jgi:hypothetical protein
MISFALSLAFLTFSATCVDAEDPSCCSGGVAPRSDCTGLDQHDCEFHLPQCAWGPSKECPPKPVDTWCCSGGVAPRSDCKGLDQHDCQFHLPQCAWGNWNCSHADGTIVIPDTPPAFPTSFSLVAAPDGYFTEAHMEGNTKTFALKKTGGSQDEHAFEAIFCNATGLYTFFSAQAGMCYYQHSKTCDDNGFRNAVAFLTFARDDTLSLLVNGIDSQSVPFSSSSGNVVWSERTPTCSNELFLDVNVTLSSDNDLLAWSKGSSVVNPLDHSCKVTNRGRTFTAFVPTSTITSKMVETFVAGRISAEGLDCMSGP